jgi:hypothetical protein
MSAIFIGPGIGYDGVKSRWSTAQKGNSLVGIEHVCGLPSFVLGRSYYVFATVLEFLPERMDAECSVATANPTKPN